MTQQRQRVAPVVPVSAAPEHVNEAQPKRPTRQGGQARDLYAFLSHLCDPGALDAAQAFDLVQIFEDHGKAYPGQHTLSTMGQRQFGNALLSMVNSGYHDYKYPRLDLYLRAGRGMYVLHPADRKFTTEEQDSGLAMVRIKDWSSPVAVRSEPEPEPEVREARTYEETALILAEAFVDSLLRFGRKGWLIAEINDPSKSGGCISCGHRFLMGEHRMYTDYPNGEHRYSIAVCAESDDICKGAEYIDNMGWLRD